MTMLAARSPSFRRCLERVKRYRYVSVIADDCLNNTEQDAGLSTLASGGSVAAETPDSTYGLDRIGLASYSTSSSSTGRAGIVFRTSAVILGRAVGMEMETEVYIPTLSDGSQTYTYVAGFGNNLASISPADAVFIRYSSGLSSGAWEVYTSSALGGSTTISSGITVVAGTWYRLRLRVPPGGHTVQAWVNEVEIATPRDQSRYPTSNPTGLFTHIIKSAGSTARSAVTDWVWCVMWSNRGISAQ